MEYLKNMFYLKQLSSLGIGFSKIVFFENRVCAFEYAFARQFPALEIL